MVNLEAAVRRPPDFGDGESKNGVKLEVLGWPEGGRRPRDSSGPGTGREAQMPLESGRDALAGCRLVRWPTLVVAETSFELRMVELRGVEPLAS